VSATPELTLTSSYTTMADEVVNYASGDNFYMVNAVVEFYSTSAELASCELIDTTSGTVWEIEDDSVDGYSNLSFLNNTPIPQGDLLAVKCETSGGTVKAEATLSAIPLG
jgi:hypothetical protein